MKGKPTPMNCWFLSRNTNNTTCSQGNEVPQTPDSILGISSTEPSASYSKKNSSSTSSSSSTPSSSSSNSSSSSATTVTTIGVGGEETDEKPDLT